MTSGIEHADITELAAKTASWSREETAAEMGLSLEAYDEAYRRHPEDMPPRYTRKAREARLDVSIYLSFLA